MSAMPPAVPHTRYSEDGFWWWDGASWKPAVSPDRLWRWNGQGWVPAQAAAAPVAAAGGPGNAILISVAVFIGVLLLVSILATIIFVSMSGQISNVFSNMFGVGG